MVKDVDLLLLELCRDLWIKIFYAGRRPRPRRIPAWAGWYHDNMVAIARIQTGLRMEPRVLKVLKGVAEYLDLSLADLVEGIVLHAFEGKAAFGEETLAKIAQLRDVYELTLTAADAHTLEEK